MQRDERDRWHDGAVDGNGRRRLLAQAMAGLSALTLPVRLATAAGDTAERGAAAGNGRPRPATSRLRSLLDRNHTSGPAFGGGQSNQVSMGLY